MFGDIEMHGMILDISCTWLQVPVIDCEWRVLYWKVHLSNHSSVSAISDSFQRLQDCWADLRIVVCIRASTKTRQVAQQSETWSPGKREKAFDCRVWAYETSHWGQSYGEFPTATLETTKSYRTPRTQCAVWSLRSGVIFMLLHLSRVATSHLFPERGLQWMGRGAGNGFSLFSEEGKEDRGGDVKPILYIREGMKME